MRLVGDRADEDRDAGALDGGPIGQQQHPHTLRRASALEQVKFLVGNRPAVVVATCALPRRKFAGERRALDADREAGSPGSIGGCGVRLRVSALRAGRHHGHAAQEGRCRRDELPSRNDHRLDPQKVQPWGQPVLIRAADVLGRLPVGSEAKCRLIFASDLFVNVRSDISATARAWRRRRRRRLNRRAQPLRIGETLSATTGGFLHGLAIDECLFSRRTPRCSVRTETVETLAIQACPGLAVCSIVGNLRGTLGQLCG